MGPAHPGLPHPAPYAFGVQTPLASSSPSRLPPIFQSGALLGFSLQGFAPPAQQRPLSRALAFLAFHEATGIVLGRWTDGAAVPRGPWNPGSRQLDRLQGVVPCRSPFPPPGGQALRWVGALLGFILPRVFLRRRSTARCRTLRPRACRRLAPLRVRTVAAPRRFDFRRKWRLLSRECQPFRGSSLGPPRRFGAFRSCWVIDSPKPREPVTRFPCQVSSARPPLLPELDEVNL